MSWLLEQILIEGFRGINNAGAPLELRFHPDKVNSVFAPNGVGKSSIFEAIKYALSGAIPKLDSLQAAERSASYYLNRFHPTNEGRIALTLKPVSGGASVTVTVTLDGNGLRTVTTSDRRDGASLLDEMDREFVLLDAKTFQDFIEDTPLTRGRSFAGLLGLRSYSDLRQTLQGLANTRSFNGHFEVNPKVGRKKLIHKQIEQARSDIRSSFTSLVGEEPAPPATNDDLRGKAHAILKNIELLKPKCDVERFDDISVEECLASVRDAEGGPEREQLGSLLRAETAWLGHINVIPTPEKIEEIAALAAERDAAFKLTQGDLFFRLFKLTEQITAGEGWPDKAICPACDQRHDFSVLEHSRTKIGLYNAVTTASDRLLRASSEVDWDNLRIAEAATKQEDEAPLVSATNIAIKDGTFTEAHATQLRARVTEIRERATNALSATVAEKDNLERRLPPSMVAVTEKIEAARRLQSALKSQEELNVEFNSVEAELNRIEKLRSFLVTASDIFSQAEAEASTRRLAAVEPLARRFFGKIMFEPVVPAISKPAGSEELRISLADFYELKNVSAQSLLSESYRNAFAISVYLAAASLYGGSAKFLVLDDITSSLDAGHQFHLMEVIRTQFSRPNAADGPQVIILSHDTLLEKYFNRNGSTPGWSHQRIEGTPRTAVLPQSNAVNRVRDATMKLLQAGNAQDAAPRIRQYLEYVLEEIITRCRIPVPMDLALTDDKRMAGYLIEAIDAQIKLHAAASSLILDAGQVQGLNPAVATITSNFLSHWSSGQTQAFSAGALLGVMQAIDNYADCFKFEPNPGDARRYYRSLSQR